MRSRLLALAGGAAAAASVPPFGYWPLAFLGVALLALALHNASPRARFGRGFVFGLGLFGVGLFWMREFSLPGFVLALLLHSAMYGLGALLVPKRAGQLLALPGALLLAELLRSRWPWGGVPLAGLDLGQAGGPLLPIASLGGRFALILATAAVGCAGLAIVRALASGKPRAALGALVACAVVVGGVGVGWRQLNDTSQGSISVVIVQGGGPRGTRAADTDEREVFLRHLNLASTSTQAVDLMVWPEDVIDVETFAQSREAGELVTLSDATGTPIVAGAVEDAPSDRYWVFSQMVEPGVGLADRYDKVHLVPVGEFFPFRSTISRLADVPSRDAISGEGPAVIDTSVGRLGMVISYEVFFGDRTRSAVQAGGVALLVPTNASSFKTGQVPGQELAASRIRAVETNRDVAQAAPTGFSGFISHRGRVVQRSSLGAAQLLYGSLQRRTGETPYVRFGDEPAILLSCALVVFGMVWRRSKSADGSAKSAKSAKGSKKSTSD